MILFAIGQNLQPVHAGRPAAPGAGRLHFPPGRRLRPGVGGRGRAAPVFNLDVLSRQVILLQAVMPTATMATFFGEYVHVDEELLSGIIAVSTLLSFFTLPLWVMVIRVLVRP